LSVDGLSFSSGGGVGVGAFLTTGALSTAAASSSSLSPGSKRSGTGSTGASTTGVAFDFDDSFFEDDFAFLSFEDDFGGGEADFVATTGAGSSISSNGSSVGKPPGKGE
jgi:hypothetical protein